MGFRHFDFLSDRSIPVSSCSQLPNDLVPTKNQALSTLQQVNCGGAVILSPLFLWCRTCRLQWQRWLRAMHTLEEKKEGKEGG